MKIEPIQFPLNLGTADELKIVFSQETVYYNLVDTSKITVVPNGPEIPYKILYSDKLVLEKQEDAETINNLVINLLGVTVID